MESCALLSSNWTSVIDRSNISPSREAKCDRSLTRGNLLDNDTQLFIFISILIMTQLHPSDPESRQLIRFSEWCFSKKKQLQPVECESVSYRRIMPSSYPLT